MKILGIWASSSLVMSRSWVQVPVLAKQIKALLEKKLTVQRPRFPGAFFILKSLESAFFVPFNSQYEEAVPNEAAAVSMIMLDS